MARTGFIHHIGTFFLFAATVLLIITDISAPVVADISLLKVELGTNRRSQVFSDNDSIRTITFGTFGYCVEEDDAKSCSDAHVGYDPVALIEQEVSGTSFSDYAHDTARALTKVMILHPIATGLAFISFFLALGAGFVGSFLAAVGAFVTFIVVLVVLITDFVSFAIVKSAVNDDDNVGSAAVASWGPASWTTLVAAILCLFSAVILLFTCCSARIHRRRESRYRDSKITAASPSRRRWF
ncbi:pali-domain-containing protein [Nemania sp. FL0031]|nr:pali-domain-containing protein [Nemania sp. FL0031]